MKLRLQGNSIRLRLGRSEVAALSIGNPLKECVELLPAHLVFTVASDASACYPSATFEGGVLSVRLPREAVARWASSDEVGIERRDASGLHLLVEKDFKCLHGAAENEADAFVNPREAASRV